MGRLEWANADYTYGVERGVLHFPQQPYGGPHVPRAMVWDGLSGVETVEVGGELVTTWYQGEKVYISQSQGQFEGRIKAFTYPDALEANLSYVLNDGFTCPHGDSHSYPSVGPITIAPRRGYSNRKVTRRITLPHNLSPERSWVLYTIHRYTARSPHASNRVQHWLTGEILGIEQIQAAHEGLTEGVWAFDVEVAEPVPYNHMGEASEETREIIGIGVIDLYDKNLLYTSLRSTRGQNENGWVGVNERSRCSTYFGEKLWSDGEPGGIDEPEPLERPEAAAPTPVMSLSPPNPQHSASPFTFHLTFETRTSQHRRIHILYNVQMVSDSKTFSTSKSSIEPSTFQWTAHSSPVPVPGARPTSYIILEMDEDSPFSWELEGILYGDDGTDPRVPMPDEIDDILSSAATLRITEYPDGTYEASGPDDVVEVLDDGRFRINAPTVGTINNAMGIFRVSSY